MKELTSSMRENVFSFKEEHKSPVRELSLSPVREEQSPLTVTTKTGESSDQEKRKKTRSSEEVFNQNASQTDGYDSEFERESQSLQRRA